MLNGFDILATITLNTHVKSVWVGISIKQLEHLFGPSLISTNPTGASVDIREKLLCILSPILAVKCGYL